MKYMRLKFFLSVIWVLQSGFLHGVSSIDVCYIVWSELFAANKQGTKFEVVTGCHIKSFSSTAWTTITILTSETANICKLMACFLFM